MGKKRVAESGGAALVDEQSGDYKIGQVSGSLFPNKKFKGASSALSDLFKTDSSVSTLVFVSAPTPSPKIVEEPSKVITDKDTRSSGKQDKQKETKINPKRKSAADLKLENRESALQNADEQEVKKSPKKAKHSAMETDEGAEQRVRGEKTKRLRTPANMAEERIKQKRTVFVGNLPASSTKKTLRALFKDVGTIESIRFRSLVREDPAMPRKVAVIQRKVHPKKQSFNAYVVFKDNEGAEKALDRNGLEIEKDCHIRVDRVTKSSNHDHKRSIFVGNLPYDVNELPLRQHFEDCGQVEAVRLVRDSDSGMGKGFGYVLFQSPDAVQLALKLNSSKLLGRSLRVKRSVKKEKEKKEAPGRGGRAVRAAEGRGAGEPNKGRPPGGKTVFKGRPGQGPRGQSFRGPVGGGRRPGKSDGSFKGEMADPAARKAKAKALRKKLKPRRRNQPVHI